MGTPVVFLDPRSKGAESYKAFAWEFMAKNPTRFDAVIHAPAPAPAAQPAAEAPEADASAALESPAAPEGADAPVPQNG